MAWSRIGTDIGVAIAAGSGTQSINLPGPPATGDLVIIAIAGDVSCADSIPSDYTKPENGTGVNPGANFGYKVMGGTPDTTVLIAKHATVLKSCVVQVWRGGNASSILDQTYPTPSTGSSANPDPPQIVTQYANALVVAIAFLDDDDSTVSNYSSGYADGKSANTGQSSSSVGSTVAVCSKVVASPATENPGAYTMSSSDQWQAGTISFRIASEAHSGSTAITGNGSVAGGVQKNGKATGLISAAGALVAIGLASMLSLAAISGGGLQGTTGIKAVSSVTSISGGGSQVAVGQKSGQVSGTISGGGTLTAAGEKFEGEPHSGTATITGGGSQATSGIKAVSSIISVSGDGSLITTGEKLENEQYSGTASLSGNGAVSSVGSKGGSGPSPISGNGVLATIGKKEAFSSPSISANGPVVAGGRKDALQSVSIIGRGAVTAPGSKSAGEGASISDNGSLIVTALKDGRGMSLLSGGGALAATGVKSEVEMHWGAAIISGGGAMVSLDIKSTMGAGTVSGNGQLTTIAIKSAQGPALISGNGTLAATGTKSEAGEHQSTVVISGGGTLFSIGSKTTVGWAGISGHGRIGVSGSKWVFYQRIPVDPEFWASKQKPRRFHKTSSKRPGCKQKLYSRR